MNLNLEESTTIPFSVQEAYSLDKDAEIILLSGGQVNETLLVDAPERKIVLRKLAPILGASTVYKTCVIASHLSSAGWEAPTIELTDSGCPYTVDPSGTLWHGMKYIESDSQAPTDYSPHLIRKLGSVLGMWHTAMQSLDFEPDSLPHFHDTNYIANKLNHELTLFQDEDALNLSRLFLDDHRKQIWVPDSNSHQIIHGDPKLNNMLYRNGMPFTLIDLDCAQRESAWIDIGDLLRSLNGKIISGDTPYMPIDTSGVFTEFLTGYQEASDTRLSDDQLTFNALQATRRIARELGMRYLSDIVDRNNYFAWDSSQHVTRPKALIQKAKAQYQVLDTVNNYLDQGES